MEHNTIDGYVFRDASLLRLALTHTSYANEKRMTHLQSNQRLEFLGDSVLSVVVSDYIYRRFPDMPEGELTKLRASVVCEATLAKCAADLRLGERLYLGHGEEMTGGRKRVSVLADAFESVLAAIYLDAGMEQARAFVLRHLQPYITPHAAEELNTDYKTAFQELVQQTPDHVICYEIRGESGPDHNKVYQIAVLVDGKECGCGSGKSKKRAEQEAARLAMAQWKRK